MSRSRSDGSSIRDVAAAAGVSVATASRVLSKSDYRVLDATRHRVEEAARRLGYVPNALARSLSRARSDVIGVVAPALRNPYYAAMVEGIDAAAKEHGLLMQLGLTGGDETIRERAIDRLLAQQVDGLIVCAGADDHRLGRTPDTIPVPMVLIGAQANPGFAQITTDNFAAGWGAGEYLWSLGHRSFVYLTAHDTWHDFRERGRGLRAFLDDSGEDFEMRVVGGIVGEHDAYDATQELVKGTLPTALLASTDRHALGALAALADAGIEVPAQVSVMGFDDYVSSSFVRPALTTMRMPAADMGRQAVASLAMLLQGEVPERSLSMQAKLVIRASTTGAP